MPPAGSCSLTTDHVATDLPRPGVFDNVEGSRRQHLIEYLVEEKRALRLSWRVGRGLAITRRVGGIGAGRMRKLLVERLAVAQTAPSRGASCSRRVLADRSLPSNRSERSRQLVSWMRDSMTQASTAQHGAVSDRPAAPGFRRLLPRTPALRRPQRRRDRRARVVGVRGVWRADRAVHPECRPAFLIGCTSRRARVRVLGIQVLRILNYPKQRVLPNLLVDPLAVLQIINVRTLEPHRANLSIGVLEREQPRPRLGLEEAWRNGQQAVARPQ